MLVLTYSIGGFLLNSGPVKSVILALNPRTYDLIYNREQVLKTDRSIKRNHITNY